MCGEGDVLKLAAPWFDFVVQALDLGGVAEQVVGQGAFDGVTGNHHAILFAVAPRLEQLSTDLGL